MVGAIIGIGARIAVGLRRIIDMESFGTRIREFVDVIGASVGLELGSWTFKGSWGIDVSISGGPCGGDVGRRVEL